MADANNGPFMVAAKAWNDALVQAQKVKDKRFGAEAIEGMRFFAGPYDFFFNQIRNDKFFRPNVDVKSQIMVTVNKVAELVQIFGPVLYHQNPTRRVTTRPVPNVNPQLFMSDPKLAMLAQQTYQFAGQQAEVDKAIASLFEAMLNVTPDKLDLKAQSRRAIDEALIKGMGILWNDIKTAPASGLKCAGSFWGSVDDFLMDPDAPSIDQIRWCARRTFMHRWEAERRWNLMPNSLTGTGFSLNGVAAASATASNNEEFPKDLVEVWEIWSKMGVGGRLPQCQNTLPENRVAYEMLGDYCYLAVIPNHPWPLNLPPRMFFDDNAWQQAQIAVQWPTPYWADNDGWPFTPIYFHEVPKDPWPLSHLTPGMGELKFLNWAYSKMASKIAVTCRDIIAVQDVLSEEVNRIINSGEDLSVLKIQGMDGKKIAEFIEFIQHPTWNSDFWRVLDHISEAFDKRVGLSELMYGMTERQDRSAAESKIKSNNVNVRPEDMANKVENSMSIAARREMFCARWHMEPKDVGDLLGPIGAMAYSVLVFGQPVDRVLSLQARVEEDSTKKPNHDALVDGLNMAMQNLLQPFFAAAQAGMLTPFNSLVTAWATAHKIPNPESFQLQAPTPPEGQQPDPRQAQAHEAQQKAQDQAHDRHQQAQDHAHQARQQAAQHQHERAIAASKPKAA